MPIVKICPVCGQQNDRHADQCKSPSCNCDLFDVPVTNIEDKPKQSAPSRMGHKCARCGKLYAFSVRRCPDCDTNLSSMAPVPMDQKQPAPACVWRFTSVDHEWTLSLSEGQTVLLGRSFEEGGYLNNDERFGCVSSEHAVVTVRGGRLYITDQSSNGTQINYQAIPRGTETEIPAGSLISLGGNRPFQQKEVAYLVAQRVNAR